MKLFNVAIRQENNTFHAQTPDIPQIHITGNSIADTIDKARTTLINHLQHLADTNQPLPDPKHINTYLIDPKFAGQTWAVISLNSLLFDNQQKSFTLHLPRSLLTQIQTKVGHSEHDVEQFILTTIEQALTQSD